MDYDAWGKVTNDTNPGFQPFGYAGGIYDRDTGLVRFGARDYDPEIGRWTTKDPIGFAGGLNHYTYVSGNPIMYFDASGLAEQSDNSVYPASMECSFVKDCMNAWQDDTSSHIGPGERPSGSGVKNAYWWLAEKAATEYGQAMICAQQNERICGGDEYYAPWRPGMPLDGVPMSELPGFPEDAYCDEDREYWVGPDGKYRQDFVEAYDKYCEQF